MAAPKEGAGSVKVRWLDYLFGRNTLIGVASLMLLVISGYATWHGMRDFIVGVSTSPAGQGREIVGGLSVSNDALVISVVVALTFLMWLALRETFGVGRRLRDRLITFPLYLFLAIWSIGFGYGFWWSLIAGEESTRTSMSALQDDARAASSVVAARLDAVRIQLDSVVSWSDSQMQREETSGGSCGQPSGAGRGPLYNARLSVRDAVASLRDGIATSWIGPVQADVEELRKSAAGLEGGTIAERQREFEAKASDIRNRARNIADRSNELGRSTAAEMRSLAEVVSIAPGKAGFSCYDPTLAQRLRQAADQAAEPADLELSVASFNEGPAGVANAIKNLWTNIGAYASGLYQYVASGGEIAYAETDSGQPITGRDLIALLATIGIDLGLFALTVLNPPSTPPLRARTSSAMIAHIRSAIDMATARAPGTDIEWVRRHFIYHRHASYLVIPNLFSADAGSPEESAKALAMNQLAGVLDDLDLVRWPTPREFKELKEEELGGSDTDLTEIRKARLRELEGNKDVKLDGAKAEEIRSAEPLRNHGLFSKAERVLTMAGWSEAARRDIEIMKLVDVEGLTPLLEVLNDRSATPVAAAPPLTNAAPAAPSTPSAS